MKMQMKKISAGSVRFTLTPHRRFLRPIHTLLTHKSTRRAGGGRGVGGVEKGTQEHKHSSAEKQSSPCDVNTSAASVGVAWNADLSRKQVAR